MKNLKTFLTLLFLFSINVNVLLATNFQGEKNVIISTETNEDSYLAGGNITIDAPVRGDLVCAGGDIIVQDTVTEDVMLVGGNLKVTGYIGDDLRVAGGTVMVMGDVNGDLIIAGGEVTVGRDVIISGNVQVAGGTLKMHGTALGDVNLRGGEIVWNGVAEKDLSAKGVSLSMNGIVRGKSTLAAQEIELGNDAQFYGDVEYWNTAGNVDFGSTLLGGAKSSYNETLQVASTDFDWRYLGVGVFAFWLYRLLAASLMIGLFIWMFHRFFSRTSEETSQNYVGHLGYGIMYVIGLPLLMIVAFVTVVGIPVGFMLMIFYLVTLALGSILASLLIAYGINNYYKKNWNRRTIFLVALCSFLALKLVGIIPFLGTLLSFIVVITAFGTLLYIWRKTRIEKTAIVE